MKRVIKRIVVASCIVALIALPIACSDYAAAKKIAEEALEVKHETKKKAKPSPEEAIEMLKAGNSRFVDGIPAHPHINRARLVQAGKENQGDHAYATVLTCSDSRVPVELLLTQV